MVEYQGLLKIYLLGAQNLPVKDVNGSSDPYFTFQIGKQILRSKSKSIINIAVHKSLNPYYKKEELILCVTGKEDLTITCWDEDLKSYGKDEYMCSSTINIENIINNSDSNIYQRVNLFNEQNNGMFQFLKKKKNNLKQKGFFLHFLNLVMLMFFLNILFFHINFLNSYKLLLINSYIIYSFIIHQMLFIIF
jgi:Ca2+-dependent lipid-binding protein